MSLIWVRSEDLGPGLPGDTNWTAGLGSVPPGCTMERLHVNYHVRQAPVSGNQPVSGWSDTVFVCLIWWYGPSSPTYTDTFDAAHNGDVLYYGSWPSVLTEQAFQTGCGQAIPLGGGTLDIKSKRKTELDEGGPWWYWSARQDYNDPSYLARYTSTLTFSLLYDDHLV